MNRNLAVNNKKSIWFVGVVSFLGKLIDLREKQFASSVSFLPKDLSGSVNNLAEAHELHSVS